MILVTGATGLTGEFVVDELLRCGHDVRVLCRNDAAIRARALPVDIALGDLCDPDSLIRASRGTTGVVHAACTLTDSTIDIAAMRALVDGWERGPFVYISSLDVYGFASGRITEDCAVTETYNDYARGKVICEQILFEAGRREVVALRAPYIWGPHPTARRRLVDQRLVENQPIVLPGASPAEWSEYRDAWVDVRDLAAIVAACLARPSGGPLNVVTGHFSWHDLYAQLIRLTGSRSELVHRALDAIPETVLPRKQLYAQTWEFSEAALSRQLGHISRRSFETTLRDTVAFNVSAPGTVS